MVVLMGIIFLFPFGLCADNLVVFAVGSNNSDGYRRFLESALEFDYEVEQVTSLELLPEILKTVHASYVLVLNGEQSLLVQSSRAMINSFKESGKSIITADMVSSRVLGFVGHPSEALEFAQLQTCSKEKMTCDMSSTDWPDKFEVDSVGKIFHVAHTGEEMLHFAEDEQLGKRVVMTSNHRPAVIVVDGKESSMLRLHSYANLVANPMPLGFGKIVEQSEVTRTLFIAIFISQATPFLEEFFNYFAQQEYSKSLLRLVIFNSEEFHQSNVTTFLQIYGPKYRSVKVIAPEELEEMEPYETKAMALSMYLEDDSEFYLNLESTAHLENPATLSELVLMNQSASAPLLLHHGTTSGNWFGGRGDTGKFRQSSDEHLLINKRDQRGWWNVPCITHVVLIKSHILRSSSKKDRQSLFGTNDREIKSNHFCSKMIQESTFMYLNNRVVFGHLVNTDKYRTDRLHSEMWEISTNPYQWEKRYLHPDYYKILEPGFIPQEPCTDVFNFPLVTERFADSMVDLAETNAKWTGGTVREKDSNGYYPTVDIRMEMIDYFVEYLEFLRRFVGPLAEKVFLGYENKLPRGNYFFVVRYKAEEQSFLAPHFDHSTYSINIALNRAGIDFEGGGTRFLRQNCSVLNNAKGWLIMHPGDLTHFHEGLHVTNGTRYILVSFVDPVGGKEK